MHPTLLLFSYKIQKNYTIYYVSHIIIIFLHYVYHLFIIIAQNMLRLSIDDIYWQYWDSISISRLTRMAMAILNDNDCRRNFNWLINSVVSLIILLSSYTLWVLLSYVFCFCCLSWKGKELWTQRSSTSIYM